NAVQSSWESNMNKRFKFSLTVSLAIILGVSPLLTLAASMQSASLKAVGTTLAGTPGNARASRSPLKPSVIAKLRAIRLPQNAQPANGIIGQSTTLLPDGRLLKVGGLGQDELLSAATIIDPRTNQSVQAVQSLQRARAWHTATVLPDGTVLILGGVG